MIGIIYNHNMYDDPYNLKKVEKGFKNLEQILEKFGKCYFSFSNRGRGFLGMIDYEDDYVLVHHTNDLIFEQKTEIANAIKETLTLKKTVYKDKLPQILIVFEKVSEENCFTFN